MIFMHQRMFESNNFRINQKLEMWCLGKMNFELENNKDGMSENCT